MAGLAQWPDLDNVLAHPPRLPVRLHRPYLALNLCRKMQLNAVRFHYHVIRRFFSPTEFSDYLSQNGLQLAKIEDKDNQIFTLLIASFSIGDYKGATELCPTK